MSTAMQRLQFTITAVNNATRPVQQVMQSIDLLQQRSQAAMSSIRNGMMTGFGAGYAFKSFLEPVREFENALGSVASLDVEPTALKQLQSQALKYSMQYGGSAADFVSASYDIQSAIAGLNGTELAQFTNNGAILAKATKSDTGTITNYMGTMYGIFKNQAAKMGNAAWVNQLTGQTAAAVQMFKTTGSEMAGAFTSLGAEATSAGISMGEQMAVLGNLQATMSGSEAGTKYRAFLAGVGKAQKQLGLSFTDSNSRLLPMVDILQKIQGKFGSVIDVAEGDALAKAFGSAEATGLIKLLMADMNGLGKSINKLSDINSEALARKMANKQLDPWERMSAVLQALSITFTQSIMPVVNWFADKMAVVGQKVLNFSKAFPNLTKFIGLGIMAVFGLVMAFSALSIIVGIVKLAILSFGAVFAVITSPITLIVAGVALLAAGLVWLWKNFDWVSSKITAFSQVILGGLLNAWESVKKAFTGSLIGRVFAAQFKVIKLGIKSFISLVNKIPGVNIDLGFDDIKSPEIPSSPIPKPITQTIERVQKSQQLTPAANQVFNTAHAVPPPALKQMVNVANFAPISPMQKTDKALQEQKALAQSFRPVKPIQFDAKAAMVEIQTKVIEKTGGKTGGKSMHIGSIHTSAPIDEHSLEQMLDASA